jgi:hypothetical protein
MSVEIKETTKVEIKKLVLELDGKEISLSIDSAEKLYKALDELFNKNVITTPTFVPVPYYTRPWYWGYSDHIYCGSNADSKFTLTGNANTSDQIGTITCSVK